MHSGYLKNEIQAYLKDQDLLTDQEVQELLFDCLCYFEKQDQKRAEFKETYKGIIENARQQQSEAAEILKDFSQLSELIKGVDLEKK